MAKAKLSPGDRRALTLRALSGESASVLAREYDVARSYVYALAEEAKIGPEAALEEAELELEFRRQVIELIGG